MGFGLAACAPVNADPLPTRAILAVAPEPSNTPSQPLPPTATAQSTAPAEVSIPSPTLTPEPTLTPISTSEPVFYEVQPGETLLAIALKFGVPLDALMLANGLTNPNVLQVGQSLQIPPETAAADEQLPIYYAQAGDTFSSIAFKFDISVEMLQQANPAINPEAVQIGQAINLPLGGHVVAWGETLSHIAERYQVTLDDLFLANRGKLDPANPHFVQAGMVLSIPSEQAVAGYDCSPQPPRSGVIEYIVQQSEQRICLEQKFGLSATTILYANLNRVTGGEIFEAGTVLLIPPNDGALYTITTADITNGVTLEDLVRWYGIQRFDHIVDWQGNPVSLPLTEGQRLFIRGADLQAGAFQSTTLAQFTPAPPATSGGTTAVQPANPAEPGPAAPTNPGYVPPAAGAQPSGTLSRSNKDVWDGANPAYDVGYCAPSDGAGWTGTLVWPAAGRTIREERGFRPGHPAIDIIGSIGDPVYAAESGVVTWAGFSSWGGGNVIVLAHGNGWRTYYAHLDRAAVTCGQSVSKGSLIGQIGKTGTGWPHLHFEVQRGAYNYEPLNWLSGASFELGPNTPFNRPVPITP